MKIFVIGAGRWGSFIAWYLEHIGHRVSLYGLADSEDFCRFAESRTNGMVTMPESLCFTTHLSEATEAETIVISIPTQSVRALMDELRPLALHDKKLVLCMKGIEIGTGARLSEIVTANTDPSNRVAVWIGPGHPQEFAKGVPNCMVIDSEEDSLKHELVAAFGSDLIRFYYGADLIGNEVGAAAKNVIGIAAGMLDGMKLSSLKGALMSRGTREVARLIAALGGNELSAYGLCHLGDYEATVFSPHSHNRAFGEAFVTGATYTALAEGYYTVRALMELSERTGVELPICRVVYQVLYEGRDAKDALEGLFGRSIKQEF